jgi:hypothetical protein
LATFIFFCKNCNIFCPFKNFMLFHGINNFLTPFEQ